MNALFDQALGLESSQPGTDPRRSAALLLHGMAEEDRRWAWSRLADHERDLLAPLLQELRDLAVPSDPAWVRQVLGETQVVGATATASASAIAAPNAGARDRLAAADPAAVAELLLGEPVGLVRRLLALGPWPWAEAVVADLRMRRGDLFEPQLPGAPAPAPALDRALVEHVASRLQASSPQPAARQPGMWARLRGRLQRDGERR